MYTNMHIRYKIYIQKYIHIWYNHGVRLSGVHLSVFAHVWYHFALHHPPLLLFLPLPHLLLLDFLLYAPSLLCQQVRWARSRPFVSSRCWSYEDTGRHHEKNTFLKQSAHYSIYYIIATQSLLCQIVLTKCWWYGHTSRYYKKSARSSIYYKIATQSIV